MRSWHPNTFKINFLDFGHTDWIQKINIVISRFNSHSLKTQITYTNFQATVCWTHVHRSYLAFIQRRDIFLLRTGLNQTIVVLLQGGTEYFDIFCCQNLLEVIWAEKAIVLYLLVSDRNLRYKMHWCFFFWK